MRKTLFFLFSCLFISVITNGCKKDSDDKGPKTFTEEFLDVPRLTGKGWIFTNNSLPGGIAAWQQGQYGKDKYSIDYGFTAYSAKKEDKSDYAYAGAIYGSNYSISSWFISPVYNLKNGDKISFYTRASSNLPGEFIDRLQVRLNETDNTADVGNTPGSTGKFSMLLEDINKNMNNNSYPQVWTKYEITISGFSETKSTRIGFRYMPDGNKANGIGIDLFTVTTY